jgi:transcriptional regulator with XRE-family HTH domain
MEQHSIDHHIGRKITIRRKLCRLSSSDLGSMMGISTQEIEQYEMGNGDISLETLFELGKSLKVNPNYFFDGYNNKSIGIVFGTGIELLNFYDNIRQRQNHKQLALAM